MSSAPSPLAAAGDTCCPPLIGQAALPVNVAAALWRAADLGRARRSAWPTGWAELDAQLPGGGLPSRALVEVLQAQPSTAEWRLLGAVLRQVAAGGVPVAVVGPPLAPHAPGLACLGLPSTLLIWVAADTPAQRLWATEQLVRSSACAVLAWLPHVRSAQLRRLQVAAQGCEAPLVVFRPQAAQHEASPASLRLLLDGQADWALRIRILKRQGPLYEGTLQLSSLPPGLGRWITPPGSAGRSRSALCEPAATAPSSSPSHRADRANRSVPAWQHVLGRPALAEDAAC